MAGQRYPPRGSLPGTVDAVDARARRLLATARAAGQRVPDDDDRAMVLAWCATADPETPPGLNRYLSTVWQERVDLQEAYPGLFLDPTQRDEFVRWCAAFGVDECTIPAELVPQAPAAARPAAHSPLAAGVVVVGHLRSVLGIGAAARRIADLTRTAGERVHRRTYDHTNAPSGFAAADVSDDIAGATPPALDVALFCVNGAQTARLTKALGPEALDGRYRIGLWFWELAELSAEQRVGLDHLDEIWVTSDFTADAIRRVAPPRITVGVIPLGTSLVDVTPDDIDATRRRLGIANAGRVIGFTFDHASRLSRKNPLAVIDAYRRAIPVPTGDNALAIKTVNADRFPNAHARLRAAAAGRPDIVITDAVFSETDQQAFVAGLSAYVSLHRSEGYGLTMLEAMARGVPVIATGWSGNLAFMDVDNSWLVPFDLVLVTGDADDTDDPYRDAAGSRWADPDVDAAAAAIADVLTGSPDVQQRIEHAREDVRALTNGSAGAAWIRARLDDIRARR